MGRLRLLNISKQIKRLIKKLFIKQKKIKLGIYGPTNAGKTTLANRICKEWIGEEMGVASGIPHETRRIQQKENVTISSKDGRELVINLIDTPGIATKIDYEDFLKYGLSEEDSKTRAKEATQGIIEAIKWLDDMDAVIVMMDATQTPYNQINITLLGNLEARNIPLILVANKMDLKNANLKRIESYFPQYRIVGISAKEGELANLYKSVFEVV